MPLTSEPGGQEVNNNPADNPQVPLPDATTDTTPKKGKQKATTDAPPETPAPEVEPPVETPAPEPPVAPEPPAEEPAVEAPAVETPVADDEEVKLPAETAVEEKDIDTPIIHPAFDYHGKVRLSQNDADAVDKEYAIEATKKSKVLDHYKETLIKQIEDEKLDGHYADLLRRILKADSAGGGYDGDLTP